MTVTIQAGEVVTTPQNIVLSPSPTTNQVEKARMTFFYENSGNHRVIIWYNLLSSDGTEVIKQESVSIQDLPDDPESITENCIGIGDPWSLCTGAGTCTNDCNESTTDFTDFVSGFGATLDSRGESDIWQDIQGKYTTQP